MKCNTALKILFLLLLTLSINACDDQKSATDENFEVYFTQYSNNIERVMKNFYLNAPNADTLESLIELHRQTLENLNRVRKRFSQEFADQQAQRVTELCDFAITDVIEYKLQLLKLSTPFHIEMKERLEQLKNDDQFAQMIAKLEQLQAALSTAEIRMQTHHEKVRKRMLALVPETTQRKLVWPVLNGFIRGYIIAQSRYLVTLPLKIEQDIAMSRFLNQHKQDYTVDERAIPIFTSKEVYEAFQGIRQKVKEEYELAHGTP